MHASAIDAWWATRPTIMCRSSLIPGGREYLHLKAQYYCDPLKGSGGTLTYSSGALFFRAATYDLLLGTRVSQGVFPRSTSVRSC